MSRAKYLFFLLISMALLNDAAFAQQYILSSPNGKLRMQVTVADSLTYAVSYKERQIIRPSAIAMQLQDRTLGMSAKVKNAKTHEVSQAITPLYGKFSKLDDHYKELKISFEGGYAVLFRAYDEGVAYRFVTDLGDSVKVMNETAEFRLSGDPSAILPEIQNLTSWEVPYITYASAHDIPENDSTITPALFADEKQGIKITLTEADLLDYPGMYLHVNGPDVSGFWAPYPAKTVLGSWGNFVSVVKEKAPYIASVSGRRAFPWRVMIITDDDKELLSSELVYKLASPSKIKQTGWIKPGKAAWEWWHDALLPGADIPSGMDNRSTALYKYYIDFAAKSHLEYMMIDAGWSNVYNIRKENPKIDIREVIAYAKQKNVGVFLWCVATSLMNDLDANMDYIKSLGASGLKVDFFDRDDQQAISWLRQIAAAAAERHLMIDFHGCSNPTGLQRTYPNVLNFEAVRGNECNKWDTTANPHHHLLIPFIRMLGGPMDYTPGSMRNRSHAAFKPVPEGLPSSQGTRCHELAMYVVFDQPLAMLCDAPTEYDKYPDVMKFLSAVPTVFDYTKVLDARVGEYAMVAKQKGKDWYIGAMTNWDAREMMLDFSFLPAGVSGQADVYTDTPASGEDAEKYRHEVITVTRQSRLQLRLASGGGAVVSVHLQ